MQVCTFWLGKGKHTKEVHQAADPEFPRHGICFQNRSSSFETPKSRGENWLRHPDHHPPFMKYGGLSHFSLLFCGAWPAAISRTRITTVHWKPVLLPMVLNARLLLCMKRLLQYKQKSPSSCSKELLILGSRVKKENNCKETSSERLLQLLSMCPLIICAFYIINEKGKIKVLFCFYNSKKEGG